MDLDFLPGSAALAHSVDARVLCVLRDGRVLVARALRSFDHFGSCILEGTTERLFVTRKEALAAGLDATATDDAAAEGGGKSIRDSWALCVAAPALDNKGAAQAEAAEAQPAGGEEVKGFFAERYLGLFIVRGENVTLISDVAPPEVLIPRYDGVIAEPSGGGRRNNRGRNNRGRGGDDKRTTNISEELAEEERAALLAAGHKFVAWDALKALRAAVDQHRQAGALRDFRGSQGVAVPQENPELLSNPLAFGE